MMKLLRSAAVLLISAATLGSMFSITASAEAEVIEKIPVDVSESILIDQADALTESEERELSESIRETAEYIDMNVLVYVSGTRIGGSDYNTQMFCEEVCFDYYDRNADSVVLYLDLGGNGDVSYAPFDFIYTRNRARFYYSSGSDNANDRISVIFSHMNPYLSRGEEDSYSAIGEYLYYLKHYYDAGPSNLRYFYVPDTGKYITLSSDGTLMQNDHAPKNWGKAALIGIVISFIITLITFFIIKRHYRFKSAPSSVHYLRTDGIQYGPSSDVFIRKYQVRTKIERSSGGGGGHSGGTSSGGGGGGNHR